MCNLEIEREREMEYLHSASYLKIRMIQERRLFILFLFFTFVLWIIEIWEHVLVHWRCICEIHLDFMGYSRICWLKLKLENGIIIKIVQFCFWKRYYTTYWELRNYSFILYDSWMKWIFVLVSSEPFLKSNFLSFLSRLTEKEDEKWEIYS